MAIGADAPVARWMLALGASIAMACGGEGTDPSYSIEAHPRVVEEVTIRRDASHQEDQNTIGPDADASVEPPPDVEPPIQPEVVPCTAEDLAPGSCEGCASEHRRLSTWAILGPFIATGGAGLDEDPIGGEARIVPRLGEVDAGHTWQALDDRLYCRNQDDYVDLYTYFALQRGEQVDHATAYAATHVWTANATNVLLQLGANDLAKVYVGERLVYEQRVAEPAYRNAHAIPVRLEAGWNRILLKITNVARIWGFYAELTGEDGTRIDGLEISLDGPRDHRAGALRIETTALPGGYPRVPYVALDATNPLGLYPSDNPSASPLRMLGAGGVPPYTWRIDGLPAGLSYSSDEGEILGTPTSVGEHLVTVTLADSGPTRMCTRQQVRLSVTTPAVDEWYTSGSRIGGLKHGTSNQWASPTDQARLARQVGYDWIAPTAFGWSGTTNGTVAAGTSPEIEAWIAAMRAEGIRVGSYQAPFDNWVGGVEYQRGGVHAYIELFHEGLERVYDGYRPALWWFDGLALPSRGDAPLQLDAIYSLLKTLDPHALVITNGGSYPGLDHGLGDLDVCVFEGANDGGDRNYWTRWPDAPVAPRASTKLLPADVWRYPSAGENGWPLASDAGEWLRVMLTLLAEPAPDLAPRIVDLDITADPGSARERVVQGVLAWLDSDGIDPSNAVIGVVPSPIGIDNAGYAVRNRTSGETYLLLLDNDRGKARPTGGTLVARNVDFTVTRVAYLPSGDSLPFTQNGTDVQISLLPHADLSRIAASVIWLQR